MSERILMEKNRAAQSFSFVMKNSYSLLPFSLCKQTKNVEAILTLSSESAMSDPIQFINNFLLHHFGVFCALHNGSQFEWEVQSRDIHSRDSLN